MPKNELWRINARLARLNELGFDTEEFELLTEGAASVRFRPTVVDEGHHTRRLAHVTGIEAHENQARRLLGAVFAYQAYLSTERNREVPEGVAAYLWLTDRWEPTLAAIPVDLRGRLEDAEIYCGILDHVAHLSAELGRDVDLGVATQAYVDTVLSRRRSERRLIDEPTTRAAGRRAVRRCAGRRVRPGPPDGRHRNGPLGCETSRWRSGSVHPG